MVTYIYWFSVIGVALLLFAILARMDHWKSAVSVALVILIGGWGAYYFKFENLLARSYGGVMEVTVPEGMHNIGMTWKENSLWVENYDPESNTCIFKERTPGGIWQGEVRLHNCNPMMPTSTESR